MPTKKYYDMDVDATRKGNFETEYQHHYDTDIDHNEKYHYESKDPYKYKWPKKWTRSYIRDGVIALLIATALVTLFINAC